MVASDVMQVSEEINALDQGSRGVRPFVCGGRAVFMRVGADMEPIEPTRCVSCFWINKQTDNPTCDEFNGGALDIDKPFVHCSDGTIYGCIEGSQDDIESGAYLERAKAKIAELNDIADGR